MTARFCELREELRGYQQRLGTAVERPGDLDHVLSIAHELNNQLMLERFLADAKSSAELQPAFRR